VARLQPPPSIESPRFQGWLRDVWNRIGKLPIGETNSLVALDEDGNMTSTGINPNNIVTETNITSDDGSVYISNPETGIIDLSVAADNIVGTVNQIEVTEDPTNVFTISTPQDIHEYANPKFSGIIFPVLTETSDYTLTLFDSIVTASDSGGDDVTVTMLSSDIQLYEGRPFVLMNDSSTKALIVATEGAETINGDASWTVYNEHDGVIIFSDGANLRGFKLTHDWDDGGSEIVPVRARDFRIPTTNYTHGLFVDYSADKVGVNCEPARALHVTDSDTVVARITSTSAYSLLGFEASGTSTSDGPTLGVSGDVFTIFSVGGIGNFTLENNAVRVGSVGNTDFKFYLSGDVTAPLLYGDNDAKRIGINTDSPDAMLHVSDGAMLIDSSANPTVTLTTSGGRTAVLQSKDSSPNASVGTTTAHSFSLLYNNTKYVELTASTVTVESGVNFNVDGGAVKITAAGSHLKLYESDAADPNDYWLLEKNSESFNLYHRDADPGVWARPLKATNTALIINEDGGLIDFRAETPGQSNALLLDASEELFSIGVNTYLSGANLTVTGSTNPKITLTSDGGRTLVLQSKDSEPYCSIGTTMAAAFNIMANSTPMITLNSSAAEVEIRSGIDFRVEGSTNAAYLFYCDEDNDRVGIGCAPSNAFLEVDGGDEYETLWLWSSGAEASGPNIRLKKQSSTVGYNTGAIYFHGENADSTDLTYSLIRGSIGSATSGAESGKLEIRNRHAGAYKNTMLVNATGIVFNDDGADIDFRVESDTLTHALFVQGSNGYVGINNSAPDQQLVVSGTIQSGTTGSNGNLYLGGPNVSIRSAYASDVMAVYTENQEIMRFNPGSVVVNELGYDIDFRVESSESAFAIFVNGDTSRIGINTSSPQYPLDVYGTRSNYGIRATAPDDEFNSIIIRKATRDATHIEWTFSHRTDNTDLWLYSYNGTSFYNWIVFDYDTGITFNDSGLDLDFRVESDTETHALFVQGSDGFIGIQNDAPVCELDIELTAAWGSIAFARIGTAMGGNASNPTIHLVRPSGSGITTYNWYMQAGNNIAGAASSAFNIGYEVADNGSQDITNAASWMLFDPAQPAAVFNEDGGNIDFRVESLNYESAIFVDADKDEVHFFTGGSNESTRVYIYGDINTYTDATVFAIDNYFMTVSSNGTNYQKGVYVTPYAGSCDIASGVTDSGYRIAADFSNYYSHADFEGTLGASYAIWARAGTYGANPTGTINNCYVINVDGIWGTNATIGTKFVGVYIAMDDPGNTETYGIYQGGYGKNYFAGSVGIGTSSPDTTLHVYNGSAGSITAHSYSAIVAEGDDNTSISILTPTNKVGYLMFGDAGDSNIGGLYYSHSNDYMGIYSDNTTAARVYSTEFVINYDDNGTEFRVAGAASSNLLNIDTTNDLIGFGINPSIRYFHFLAGTIDADPCRVLIWSNNQATTAQYEEYCSLEFGVNGGANGDGTQYVTAAIRCIDTRTGNTSYDDGGLAFETLNSTGGPVRHMIIDDDGCFAIGTHDGVTDVEVAEGYRVHIRSNTAKYGMLLEIDDDGSTGPLFSFRHSSASPAINDEIARIYFQAQNDAAQTIAYAAITSHISDETDGTEDAVLNFYRRMGGAWEKGLILAPSAAIFNDSGRDTDFRVESTGNAYALFVDAGESLVYLGYSVKVGTPGANSLQIYDPGRIDLVKASTGVMGSFKPLSSTRNAVGIVADPDDLQANSELSLYVDTVQFIKCYAGTGVIINEGGEDLDFRVESTGNASMLAVDAGMDQVVIGTAAIAVDHVALRVADAIAFRGNLDSVDMSAMESPGGCIMGWNATGGVGETDFVAFKGGGSRGGFMFWDQASGTAVQLLNMHDAEAVFNDTGEDIDFRVESDGLEYMLFVDAGNDIVKVGGINEGSAVNPVFGVSSTTIGDTLAYFNCYDGTKNPRLWIISDDEGIVIHNTYTATASDLIFKTGAGAERFRISAAKCVFNEDGADVDFRVESDANTHMLFVDAGEDTVGIGADCSTRTGYNTELVVAGSDYAVATFVGTGSSLAGATVYLCHESASPADNDLAGTIYFCSYNDDTPLADMVAFGEITVQSTDVSDGDEHGRMVFYTMVGGVSTECITIAPTSFGPTNGVVINEGGDVAISFRVETPNYSNALLVEAGGETLNSQLVYGANVSGRDVYISSLGQFGYYSSMRWHKENIEPINRNVLERLQDVEVVQFNNTLADGEFQYGMIAEDLQYVIPELTWFDDDREPAGVDYKGFVPLLIAKEQEHEVEIRRLRRRVAELEQRLAA
jgi:hypothetical protein